jgi:hypothetical protein
LHELQWHWTSPQTGGDEVMGSPVPEVQELIERLDALADDHQFPTDVAFGADDAHIVEVCHLAASALSRLSATLEQVSRERDEQHDMRLREVVLATQRAEAAEARATAAELALRRIGEAIDALREGNMMLDNEPVMFVHGFETAVVAARAAVNRLRALAQQEPKDV